MIISNATPLIAFAGIGQMAIFRKVVKKIVIPAAVADEISECKSVYHARIDLKRETWISVRTLRSESQVRLLLPLLDRGEAEVIALAIEENAKLLLLDELTARKVAKSLNLNVLGTVGILIRAKQMGEIAFVKPFLENMIQRGIRYSQRFLTSVLKDIGE